MFNWAKQQLANVAGTQEPIYGPAAIQSVNGQASDFGFTELTKNDLRWVAMDSTCVETQTFYLMADSGYVGMAQIIYSNVAGLRTTCQFNTKIFYPDGTTPNLWSSDPLSNVDFDDNKFSFFADGCSMELSEDGSFYTIKSATNDASLVNLKVTRAAPGFVAGKNGTTYYGTDPKAPWGSMRHAFWPRCNVEGSIITKAGEIDFKGRGFYSFALQGMKPHHAAARWNFANFQGPTYSAVMMEFVTPPSYGDTVVRVGGIATDGKIIAAGAMGSAKHTEVKQDTENDWPEPTVVNYHWAGKTPDGKELVADLEGPLGKRLDRVDIMAEVPGFVKNIVAAAAGTKPWIYQYGPTMELNLKIGDEVIKEKGSMYTEATFIS